MIIAPPPVEMVRVPRVVERPPFDAGLFALLGLGVGLGFVGLVSLVSLPAAGLMYAVGYLFLTWVRPDLALLLMFAAAPFPYDLGGGPVKMALAEINLVLAAPVLVLKALLRRQPSARNPIRYPVLAYFGVCLLSSLHAGLTSDGIKSLAQMWIYMVLAVYIFSSCVNDLRLFYSALYGLLLSSLFLAVLGIVTRHEFLLGLHKNSVGTSLSYAVIVCGELWLAEPDPSRRRRLSLLACVLLAALFFSLSRGAWVASAAGLCVVTGMRRQFRLLIRGALVSAVVIAICWQLLPKERQDYATSLDADSYNVKARLISIEYAMQFFHASPAIGVGVGLRKEYDATNVVVSTLAETGVVGLASFLSIFLILAWSLWRARNRLSMSDPLFSLLAIGLALAMCQFLHGLVDHYWSRALLVPWAATGMALYARDARRE